MTAIIILAIGLMIGFGIIQAGTSPKIEVSDHYNGKKFINPTLEEQISPSFGDIIKMIREGRPKWPENLENLSTPNFNENLISEDISITFVNHASFLIQTKDATILTDPVWSERVSPVSWFGPKRVRKPGVLMDSLPAIDVIVISHNHYDHLDKETLKQLNDRFAPLVLVPVGDKDLVQSLGIENVEELDWWETVEVNSQTKIAFTPSQHSSARGLFDRDKSLWGSYFIESENRSIYFGGDGGYSTHFSDIQDRMGAPEFAILGIGAYKPKFFMQPIHLDPAEAVQAHLDLGAEKSIGMHFGTFQMASEGFDQPLIDLTSAMDSLGILSENFFTLHEGETRIYRRTINSEKNIQN